MFSPGNKKPRRSGVCSKLNGLVAGGAGERVRTNIASTNGAVTPAKSYIFSKIMEFKRPELT